MQDLLEMISVALGQKEKEDALDQEESHKPENNSSLGHEGSNKILEKLDHIIDLLEQLLGIIQDRKDLFLDEEEPLHPLDPRALLNLEAHLRETLLTVNRLGRATAEEIGEEMGKNRSTANLHLLSLRKLGMIDRERGHAEDDEESKKYYWFIRQ
ncbi:MAG: hypothetical protein ACFFCZ_21395 [Promethearchaeota archaeon]